MPPLRDLAAESRDALRRFRESVDIESIEDEPTQPVQVIVNVPIEPARPAIEIEQRGAAPERRELRSGIKTLGAAAAVAGLTWLASALQHCR